MSNSCSKIRGLECWSDSTDAKGQHLYILKTIPNNPSKSKLTTTDFAPYMVKQSHIDAVNQIYDELHAPICTGKYGKILTLERVKELFDNLDKFTTLSARRWQGGHDLCGRDFVITKVPPFKNHFYIYEMIHFEYVYNKDFRRMAYYFRPISGKFINIYSYDIECGHTPEEGCPRPSKHHNAVGKEKTEKQDMKKANNKPTMLSCYRDARFSTDEHSVYNLYKSSLHKSVGDAELTTVDLAPYMVKQGLADLIDKTGSELFHIETPTVWSEMQNIKKLCDENAEYMSAINPARIWHGGEDRPADRFILVKSNCRDRFYLYEIYSFECQYGTSLNGEPLTSTVCLLLHVGNDCVNIYSQPFDNKNIEKEQTNIEKEQTKENMKKTNNKPDYIMAKMSDTNPFETKYELQCIHGEGVGFSTVHWYQLTAKDLAPYMITERTVEKVNELVAKLEMGHKVAASAIEGWLKELQDLTSILTPIRLWSVYNNENKFCITKSGKSGYNFHIYEICHEFISLSDGRSALVYYFNPVDDFNDCILCADESSVKDENFVLFMNKNTNTNKDMKNTNQTTDEMCKAKCTQPDYKALEKENAKLKKQLDAYHKKYGFIDDKIKAGSKLVNETAEKLKTTKDEIVNKYKDGEYEDRVKSGITNCLGVVANKLSGWQYKLQTKWFSDEVDEA